MSKSPASMIGCVVLYRFRVPSSIDLALQVELSILHYKAIPVVTINTDCKDRIRASLGCLQNIYSCVGSGEVPGRLGNVTIVRTMWYSGTRSYFQTRVVFNDSYFVIGEVPSSC